MENPQEGRGCEPGAARFGNFPDYYKFNPTGERMKFVNQLCTDHINDLRGQCCPKFLDIGCNTGDLTVSIWQWLAGVLSSESIELLGVDVDEELIKCAKKKYGNQYNMVQFRQLNVMTDGLPLISEAGTTYSIIFCFSVTLWIHINYGDEGLKNFLTMMSQSCKYLLLEAQPWKCYRNAVRRAKRAHQPPFTHYESLTIRSDVTSFIESFLIDHCDMHKVVALGNTEWGRDIVLYKSNKLRVPS